MVCSTIEPAQSSSDSRPNFLITSAGHFRRLLINRESGARQCGNTAARLTTATPEKEV